MSLIIDGSNGLTFPNSTIQASAGKVLQVVTATYVTSFSTSSTSFVATGLTASITPKFSTSKILAIVSPVTDNLAANNQATLTLYRNSTNIGASLAAGGVGQSYTNGGRLQAISSFSLLDSPATTSSVTYTLYVASTNGGTVGVSYSGQLSSITLLEIAA